MILHHKISAGFPAGTLVHTNKGLIPIQDMKVGDIVLSRPEWGECDAQTEYKCVTRTFCSGNHTLVQIPYIRESNPNLINIIYITDHHEVWLEDKNEWVSAIELIGGDKLSFIENDEMVYVVGPTEVFEHKMLDGRLFGKCDSDFNAGYEVGQSILKVHEGILKTINISDIDPNYSNFEYKDDYPKLDISKDDPYTGNAYMGGKKFYVPIYNLEVDHFHTYFVGNDGLWVHNNKCLSRYKTQENDGYST